MAFEYDKDGFVIGSFRYPDDPRNHLTYKELVDFNTQLILQDQAREGVLQLARIRKQRHMSQARLAELCSVHEMTVNGWEARPGKIALKFLCRICWALEIPLTELLKGL